MRYRLTFVSGLAVGYVLGTRAGREQYERLRKAAHRVTQNPAVHDAAKNALDAGRTAAARAADTVAGAAGDKLPDQITERVRYLREHGSDDGWGSDTA
ncbi:hypothetical protein AQ490_11155 [Wenjunlia vitaminophila]|uniref:YtxH domain-containing protein n=1 Tax=Wenjunlia vitaminophila TaxID=76728 RepID=A0A0T6LKG7_WENVI|nr:hypothetical protein [Wenjunlia vitaminophila]KRV46452.1 hypothetical protein AQ490_11155 [Wenjunlia vitaminophila]